MTDSTFDSEVLQLLRPVLVYSWGEWCEECRYMSPIIEAVAEAKMASIQVAFLNVDENPRVTKHCLIGMVPTTILFIRGKERERIEGLTNQVHLSRTIDMHIADSIRKEIDETSSIN